MYILCKKVNDIKYTKKNTWNVRKQNQQWFTSASLRGTNSPKTSFIKPGLVITQFRFAERLKASFNLRSSASVTEKEIVYSEAKYFNKILVYYSSLIDV